MTAHLLIGLPARGGTVYCLVLDWVNATRDQVVEALAVGWLLGQSQAYGAESQGRYITELPWKSDDLSRACQVEPPAADERHTALGDARWVKRWYEALTGGAP